MSDGKGPWDHAPPPEPSRVRTVIWVVVVVAAGALVWGLFRLFPGGHSDWEWSRLIWLLVILGALSTAIVRGGRFPGREIARNAAVWLAIAAVLVLGYTYRDELGAVATRVRSEFVPGTPVETSPHALTITASEDGNFYVYGDVQGTRVRFVVDTGASEIVLSPSDARRAGIDMASLDFRHGYETANGLGGGAPVMLGSLAIGPIRFTDVPAAVNRAEMTSSLLGMTFLKRLDGFEIRGRTMTLRWH